MKIILTILISCTLIFSQTVPVTISDILTPVAQDTTIISGEELFLKEISDKALAKEEKREKITNRVLVTLVVILLVDKLINK